MPGEIALMVLENVAIGIEYSINLSECKETSQEINYLLIS